MSNVSTLWHLVMQYMLHHDEPGVAVHAVCMLLWAVQCARQAHLWLEPVHAAWMWLVYRAPIHNATLTGVSRDESGRIKPFGVDFEAFTPVGWAFRLPYVHSSESFAQLIPLRLWASIAATQQQQRPVPAVIRTLAALPVDIAAIGAILTAPHTVELVCGTWMVLLGRVFAVARLPDVMLHSQTHPKYPSVVQGVMWLIAHARAHRLDAEAPSLMGEIMRRAAELLHRFTPCYSTACGPNCIVTPFRALNTQWVAEHTHRTSGWFATPFLERVYYTRAAQRAELLARGAAEVRGAQLALKAATSMMEALPDCPIVQAALAEFGRQGNMLANRATYEPSPPKRRKT